MNKQVNIFPYDVFLNFTDVTEIVDETVEEEECKTIEEEMCSQPTPQFGEKCQDVEVSTVKFGFKELQNKEQIGFKEVFTDYQLIYTINLLLNKERLPI